MKPSWVSITAAWFVFMLGNVVGAIFFFRPIADGDIGSELLIHPLLGVVVYVTLGVGLLVVAARMTGSAFKAAIIIAAAQFILVDVDFVLRGERGVATAAASALLIAVTWFSAALVYSWLCSNTALNKHK